jgi:hypothetical protein
MHYLMWQDTDPKKPEERKVAEARRRFIGREPSEVLVKGGGVYWLGPI